jgi:hypothetical protein
MCENPDRQIELYHNADGKVYCLLNGPDEETIRKHHQALNAPAPTWARFQLRRTAG